MRRLFLILAALALLGSSETPEVDTAALGAALQEFNTGARFPLPTLSEAQLERLLAGKVVKIREKQADGGPQRGIGLLRTDVPRADVWLAVRDAHLSMMDELHERQLTPPEQMPAVWYQLLDLPRPFADRHWVIDVSDNHALARATGNRCWEHPWVLKPDGPAIAAEVIAAGRIPGVDVARGEDAIYTPVNHGAWIAVQLPDETTILAYHATSVIGGRIPDKLVADYMMLTLSNLLRGVVERAPKAVEHYGPDHARIQGADGVTIPSKGGRGPSIGVSP